MLENLFLLTNFVLACSFLFFVLTFALWFCLVEGSAGVRLERDTGSVGEALSAWRGTFHSDAYPSYLLLLSQLS